MNFGIGCSVWLVDSWVCRLLIDARHSVGLPLAFLLELHGWYVIPWRILPVGHLSKSSG